MSAGRNERIAAAEDTAVLSDRAPPDYPYDFAGDGGVRKDEGTADGQLERRSTNERPDEPRRMGGVRLSEPEARAVQVTRRSGRVDQGTTPQLDRTCSVRSEVRTVRRGVLVEKVAVLRSTLLVRLDRIQSIGDRRLPRLEERSVFHAEKHL